MGASFARTDAQKKQHKERSQPFNRQRYGLLEKKKDYVLRATDYKQKQARLKTLRAKAANKNEDEFYFGMINKTTKNGVAVASRGNTALPQSVTHVLKTQDANYIKTIASVERAKVHHLKDRAVPRGSTHGQRTVFVDDLTDTGTHDLDLHIDARREKRQSAVGGVARRGTRIERELQAREARLKQLDIMERETALQRALQGKGARRKVGTDKDGVAKYKWKQERKR